MRCFAEFFTRKSRDGLQRYVGNDAAVPRTVLTVGAVPYVIRRICGIDLVSYSRFRFRRLSPRQRDADDDHRRKYE
jgi:hypothetical protein